MKLRIAGALIAVSIVAAGVVAAAPSASKSEYFQTTAAGISISEGTEPLYYSLMLKVRKKLDGPLYARTHFERPGAPDDPLVVDTKIEPDDSTVFLDSPNFQGIENGETYSVELVLYADEKLEQEISRHRQDVQFRVPKQAFKKLGLKRTRKAKRK